MHALQKPARFLWFCFLLFAGLYFSKTVLVPLTIAGLLAMLVLPLATWFEKKGIKRGLAAVSCLVVMLIAIALLLFVLQWQFSGLLEDLSGIEQRITQLVSDLKQWISSNLGVSPKKQNELIKEQQSSTSGQLSSVVTAVMNSLMSVAVDLILVLVYIFLLLFFRSHLKAFVLKLTPPEDHLKARQVIQKSSEVAQSYLGGLGGMIVTLWVLYGVGFSIVGVEHAIFLGILCGLFEIIPFIGNLTGTGLTVLITIAQGGDSSMIIGIILVYGLVQFVQTYVLEPLIVGSGVNINPLFTILGIVIGETIWGIPGMILALPLIGIIKIICDHVEALQPYGFLIGENKKKDDTSIMDKIKGLFGKS
ncbi:AI-2E family transporter [Siphonobacter sp. SORGH_AS_0500]|uniref:AI-2E family transporter n=1 Tax=Siphonobacter sp. SORGH_AS_0500 TaxID=1864824 RepID=UPI002865475D|nr:AI-2E family transporter [Siphonobacter sp. SORGH_AS_0500]MDR6197553.1 putative PurR-regulated permease PerM [Siphonobacter sp. SORGH_AS_0500]